MIVWTLIWVKMFFFYCSCYDALVLWRCWLGGRKGIRPVKNFEWWGTGMVICLERGADLHVAVLMSLPLTVSCFSKIQIGFTLLVPAHPGSPGKGPLNGCVCVCVPVMMSLISYLLLDTWSHTMLTHLSPHSIEPPCCLYLSFSLSSERFFSVVLFCRQTILICLLILCSFLDANKP